MDHLREGFLLVTIILWAVRRVIVLCAFELKWSCEF